MNLEGHVRIDLPRAKGLPVRVEFSRPGDINSVLRGRDPDVALRLLPVIYSVCATAQAHAAVVALERATGVNVSPQTTAARQALTGMETTREHLLRIALDWPGFVGQAPRGANVRLIMAMVAKLTRTLFGKETGFCIGLEAAPDRKAALTVIDEAEGLLADEIFAEPTEQWLARGRDGGVADWARNNTTIAALLIDRIMQEGWSDVGDTPAVSISTLPAPMIRDWLVGTASDNDALPGGDRVPIPEATLYSRRSDDPVVTMLPGSGLGPRLVARLVELARLPGELRDFIGERNDAVPSSVGCDGVGWSAVEAARGLLVHAVELKNGVIANYRILPPTRWNFDPEGVANRCLMKIDGIDDDSRLYQANLLVNTIDPCVAHEVRVH